MVSKVIELKEGHIRIFEGNYSDYLHKREHQSANLEITPDTDPSPAKQTAGKKSKEQKRLEAEARQKVSKERNSLKKLVAAAESDIARLETEKTGLEKQMSNPETYQDGEHIAKLQKAYAVVQKVLAEKYQEWEAGQEKLERLMSEADTD